MFCPAPPPVAIVPPTLTLEGVVAVTPLVKVILSPESFPNVRVPALAKVVDPAPVILEVWAPAPPLNTRFTAAAGVDRAWAVSAPLTLVVPPLSPLKSRVPVPRFTTPSVFVPDPVKIKLQFDGPGMSYNVIFPLPLLSVVFPVNVMVPAVPKLIAAFVVLIVPARLLLLGAVAVTPPVKVKLSPASSPIVRLPVLLKVTAFVIVPPAPNRTLYPWAAVLNVPIVTAPWKSIVCPALVLVRVTVEALNVLVKVTPVEFVIVRELAITIAEPAEKAPAPSSSRL
jgi:hypothetical protein